MEVKVLSAGADPSTGVESPSRVAVRSLRIWDWKRVRALLLATYPTLDPQWLATELRTAGHRFAVAVAEGRVVGCLRMDIRPETHVVKLDLLAVDPGSSAGDVVTALLRYVDEVGMTCGTRQMTVHSLVGDVDAGALLQGCGFRTLHTEPASPSALQEGKTLVLWARGTQALPLPDWRLRDKHAPRVPMGPMMRTAQAALYGMWVAEFGIRASS